MQKNRSSELRRLTARLPVLLLALAAALAGLLLGSVGVGQAQTAASLIEVEGGGTRIGFEGERALGFRTAASAGTGFDGWLVTEVELRIRPDDATGTIRTATPPGLALCEATSSGDPHPNGTCFPLTAPATVQIPTGMTTGQEVTYTATGSGHFLATDTEYTLHFTENNSTHAGRVHHLDASTNDGEAVHVAGAFANVMRQLNADGRWSGSSSSVAWARITGYPGGARTNAGYSGALVSNIVQTSGGTTNLAVNDAFQDFTTGENDDGYTLDGIEITLQGAGAGTPPTVTLHSVSATGPKVADFTGPSSLVIGSTSNYTYVPTTTVTLSKSTIYFVIVQGGDGLWPYTTSDYEEFAAPGWSIGNASLTRPVDTTGIFYLTVGGAGLLRVKGTVNQPPPGSLVARSLVSNVGQTDAGQDAISETHDLAQSFTTGTNRAGYVLNSVDIRFVSTASGVSSDPPTVTLHTGSATGTAVAVLSRTGAIMAKDNYEFAAASPVPLTHSTAYWVVAEGGGAGLAWVKTSSTSEDAGGAGGWMIADRGEFRTANSNGVFSQFSAGVGLSLRVNGLSNPSPATGAGSINAPNAFRVPAKLFVTFVGLVDPNGVTNIADTATYTWNRFAANGTTLEPASIGTGPTYTLTDQDAGRKLRVVVSFFDDDGYPEGPLNSVPTPVINAAATCAAPTLTGGATQLGPARKVTVESYGMSPDLKYGFSAAAGMLDNATFTTTAPNNYDIESIHTTDSSLEVELNTALTANEKRTVALHVCDQAYAFKSGTLSGSTYTFTSPSQDWSGHAERLVYLSQDTTVPTFVEARVNGTSLVMTFSEDLGAAASLANGAFTVKKGSGGTTQTLSGSPSISGSTVTLTLATTVTATDTGVKVAYTKPTTGTANKMVDTFDNEVATFPDQNVINALADSVPPVLAATDAAVLAANGLTLTLTYNEALKESAAPDNSVFTVKATPAGGSEAEVALASSDGVTVRLSTVVLKLAVPIAHNDGSVRVSYAKPAMGAVIEDANGNDAADFDRAVTNNSTVPRVSIEAVHADASSLIANPVFLIRRSNMGAAHLNVEVSVSQTGAFTHLTDITDFISSGQTEKEHTVDLDYAGNTSGDLTFTVAEGAGYVPALAPDGAATVQVKAPASGLPLSVRHDQASWTVDEGETVAPTVTFTLAPGLADPRDHFDAYLETVGEVAKGGDDFVSNPQPIAAAEPGDWQPASGGGKTQTVAITYVTLQDTVVEPNEVFYLRFSSLEMRDSPDVPTTLPDRRTTISILDDDALEVTDVEVTSTPTGGYYSVGDTIEFTVTFSAPVKTASGPQFAFELAGQARQAAYTGTDDMAEQTFEYTVANTDADDYDGISWGANALGLNGGSITIPSDKALIPRNADLNHAAQGALPGHKVDTMKPSLEEAEVDGVTLSLFFSEDLNTTAPANTAFTVKVDGGTGAIPTAVSISGSVVTLTLATAVTQEQTATVSYTKPATNKIRDLSGKEADSFTDRTVDPASDIANLRATPGNRRVRLEWDNPGDSTIQRYQYRFMSTSDSVWNPDWRSISGSNANTTSFTATGLTNGIEYTFQVRTIFRQGMLFEMGKEGEVKSVPRGPIAAPRNLAAASAGDGEIALSWDDPGDITLTGYQYRYRNPSDGGWNPDWTDISGSGATTTSHTLSGLTNFLLYTLEVRALRDGTGGPSARATQKPRGPLTAPANFAAASGEDRRATLSWDNSGDDSITRYQYRYRISTVSAWDPDWTDIPGSRWNTTSYAVRSLVNQTGYTFEVRALRGTLEGPESSDTATPEGPPSVPLPPRSLTVHPADRSLGLSWQPPVEEDSRAPVTGYRVRYREEGRSWRTVSRSDGLTGWQTITGLRNGTTYEVQVASVNSVGAGAWTETRGVPEAPQVGEPPPQPRGDEAFDVGQLGVWWDGTDPNGRNWGNDRQMDSCAGTYSFTVIWEGPEDDRNAEEWAAHITLSGNANGVTYSFRRSPDTQGDYYEMNGIVRLDGQSALSIRVRGRYGSTWGEWSAPSGLYCFEN